MLDTCIYDKAYKKSFSLIHPLTPLVRMQNEEFLLRPSMKNYLSTTKRPRARRANTCLNIGFVSKTEIYLCLCENGSCHLSFHPNQVEVKN